MGSKIALFVRVIYRDLLNSQHYWINEISIIQKGIRGFVLGFRGQDGG